MSEVIFLAWDLGRDCFNGEIRLCKKDGSMLNTKQDQILARRIAGVFSEFPTHMESSVTVPEYILESIFRRTL